MQNSPAYNYTISEGENLLLQFYINLLISCPFKFETNKLVIKHVFQYLSAHVYTRHNVWNGHESFILLRILLPQLSISIIINLHRNCWRSQGENENMWWERNRTCISLHWYIVPALKKTASSKIILVLSLLSPGSDPSRLFLF